MCEPEGLTIHQRAATRSGVLIPEEAPAKLDYAEQLGIHSVPSRPVWRGALRRALDSGVAACDTLFVELADRQSLPLVTFDARLQRYMVRAIESE